MSVTYDGIYIDGQKATFHPEDILTGDATAYTEEIGTAVNAWMEENVTGGEQVTDTTLALSGVPADAKVTGDEIAGLKEDLSDFTSNKSYTYAKDKSITASNPLVQNAEGNWESVIVPCAENDVFCVKGFGGNSTRLWMFADSNGNCILQSSAALHTNDYIIIIAPANAAYLSCNSKYTEINGSLIKGTFIRNELLTIESELNHIWTIGKNLIDKNSINQHGGYVAYDDGILKSNSSYMCIAVPVIGGNKISVNQPYAHIVFSSDKNLNLATTTTGSVINGFISGVVGGNSVLENVSIPANAVFAVVSFATSQLNDIQVEYGAECTEYEAYGYAIDGNVIRKQTVPEDCIVFNASTYEYRLKADGSGDYSTIRDCVEAINALSSYDKAIIYLEEGTYDIRASYTNTEWNETGFKGLAVPKNVTIIGTGKKKSDVVITCTSEITSDKISTLNLADNNGLENLTLYGNNVRYVVHDDFSDYYFANEKGSYRKMIDVDFIGEDLIYDMVYGAGTQGGADWLFERCRFIQITPGVSEFSVHDRYTTSSTFSVKPEKIVFKDCEFIGSKNSIRLCPAVGKVEETIIFDHCIMSGVSVTSQYTGDENSTTVYNVIGSGNSEGIEFSYFNEHDKLTIPKFADTTKAGINKSGSAFAIGDYCKVDSDGGLIDGTQSDHDGVVLNDSAINGVTYYVE